MRAPRSVFTVFVSAALAVLAEPRAASGQANYKLAPVGGRTTLVGGTGLAYGRDSASSFMNPATVVRIDPGRLAFSVNFYTLSFFRAGSWYQPGEVDRAHFGDVSNEKASVTAADFDTLPGSLCVFLRAGDIPFLARGDRKELAGSQARIGFCLATTQGNDFVLTREDYLQKAAVGGTRQAQTVVQTFRRTAAGPTYAMYITNALALGASIHLSRAGYRSVFESTSISTSGGRSITSGFFNSAHANSYDVNATFGATYRIGRFQTVALALELPSLHIFGTGGLNSYSHYDGAGEATSTVTARGDFAAYTPLRIGLGTGVERAWGSAEINFSYHLPLSSAYRASLDGRAADVTNGSVSDRDAAVELSTRGRGVVNVGVGGQAFIAPYVSLLAGLGTDITTAKKGTLTQDPMTFFPSRTNRVTASMGVGSHGEGGDLLIGGELSYEFGERRAVNAYQLPPRFETVDTQTYGLLLVIAGSTSYKAIKRAVNDITNAVDPAARKPEPKAPAPPPPPPVIERQPFDPKG